MAGLHSTGSGKKIKVQNSYVRKINRDDKPLVRRSVTVFECVFCRTAHIMESSSSSLSDSHKAINDLLDAGCSKCGGRVMFKEHRHISDDALNGRR